MCPECGSTEIRAFSFDFGVDRETGYHDAGEGFECLDCGARGDAEDADETPSRIPPASETRLPDESALVTRRNA